MIQNSLSMMIEDKLMLFKLNLIKKILNYKIMQTSVLSFKDGEIVYSNKQYIYSYIKS